MCFLNDVRSITSGFSKTKNSVRLNIKFRYCPKDKAQNDNTEGRKVKDKEKGVEFHDGRHLNQLSQQLCHCRNGAAGFGRGEGGELPSIVIPNKRVHAIEVIDAECCAHLLDKVIDFIHGAARCFDAVLVGNKNQGALGKYKTTGVHRFAMCLPSSSKG